MCIRDRYLHYDISVMKISGVNIYWRAAALLLSVLLILPLGVLFYYFSLDSEGVWQHLYNTVLPEYIYNSAVLIIDIGISVCFSCCIVSIC